MDIGAQRQDVVFDNPGAPVADGDGGYTQVFTTLEPKWWMAVRPATSRDLERVAAGTVLSTATLIATGRYLVGVNTQTRMRWTDAKGEAHLANVTGKSNPDGQCIEMVLTLAEVVT